MGATKSKVDRPPDEDTDIHSLTSESTLKRVETSRKFYGYQRRRSDDRTWMHGGSSPPSPDENLFRPFTYRTRKDRLLDSLYDGAGDHLNHGTIDDIPDDQSAINDAKQSTIYEKKSVQKIVESVDTNLIAKKDGRENALRRRSKSTTPKAGSPRVSGNLLRGKESDLEECKRKISSKKLKSRKCTAPTGDEEKIIETLIQPLRRTADKRGSSDGTELPPKLSSFDNAQDVLTQNDAKTPPPPPPIDFSYASASDGDSGSPTNRSSNQQGCAAGNSPSYKKLAERSSAKKMLPKELPSHLKELKMRFTNDVPRTPYQDNVRSIPTSDEVVKQPDKQGCPGTMSSAKTYFTNDIPLTDSLHIFSTDCAASSQKVVIRGAKHSGVKSDRKGARKPDERVYSENVKDVDSKNDILSTNIKISGKKSLKDDAQKQHRLKLTYLHPDEDDVITCFPVKTEYDKNPMNHSRKEGYSKDRKSRCKKDLKEIQGLSQGLVRKTVRTQTSSTGLIHSSVQTWPDIEFQIKHFKRDAEIQCESSRETNGRRRIRGNAEEVTKKRQKSKADERGKNERPAKCRNGSTQWREMDLLENLLKPCVKNIEESNKQSSNDAEQEQRNSRRASRKSKSEARLKDCSCSTGDKVGRREQDVCCLHVQMIPSERSGRNGVDDEISKRTDSKQLDRLSRAHRTSRETTQTLCERCSKTQFSSSERLSTQVNYATITSGSQDLSLLSPFCSKSTVGTRAESQCKIAGKCQDLYRQMEELGLGFLREGEWVPTDVISRTLWKNLERCRRNCQATWRRRSRSFTHSKTLGKQ